MWRLPKAASIACAGNWCFKPSFGLSANVALGFIQTCRHRGLSLPHKRGITPRYFQPKNPFVRVVFEINNKITRQKTLQKPKTCRIIITPLKKSEMPEGGGYTNQRKINPATSIFRLRVNFLLENYSCNFLSWEQVYL